MCGIAGIVGPGELRRDIAAMVAAQAHRGPDDHGIWIDDKAGVALGHNRLSIIDLSAAGRQPMTDGHGLWLIFNGEIYNYRELYSELSGFPFRTQTDSEVILAAWRRWGERCLERFIGMFAFALWDERTRSLFCARDRLGVKPLHYAWHNGRLIFASEAKAILAAGVPAAPDMDAWAAYLVHGLYDHSERTFFSGIRTLPPGHCASFAGGRWTTRRYWEPATFAAEPLVLSDDAAADRLNELFKDSVRLRLRADVPVGVNLSGGLDSSMLVATADQLIGDGNGRMETFTLSFGDPQYDEQSFADQVPRRNEWLRHVVVIKPEECWNLLTPGLWHQEAPFGGVATVGYHKLHREARRQGIVVLLDGQGADETLAGYPYFRPHYWCDLLEAKQSATLRRELRALPADERAEWLAHTRALMRLNDLSLHYDGTSTVPAAGLSPDLVQRAARRPGFERPFADRLSSALWRDTRHTKLPRVLRMNDRLSMASSAELREPFLDHRIVELAFRLPSRQKIRLGQGKFVQRHALRTILAPRIHEQAKRLVVTPQREWFRGAFQPLTEEVLHSKSFAQRGLFSPGQAQRAYADFAGGRGDNSFFAWQWINTELWFRTFIDGSTRPRVQSLDAIYAGRHAEATPGQSAAYGT
jgi:asparagine synthase (glutamine-hydrolysing)